MIDNNNHFLIISILLVLSLILIPGAASLSISYSSTTNTNGAYSSSVGGSSTSMGSEVDIQTSSVISSPSTGSGSNTVGNETESFTVDDPPSSDPDFGDLRIETSPIGGLVTLNTFVQPNQTPMMITMLNPGTYALVVKIEGYEPFSQEVEIIKGKVKTVIADFDGNYTPDINHVVVSSPEETKSAGVWS